MTKKKTYKKVDAALAKKCRERYRDSDISMFALAKAENISYRTCRDIINNVVEPDDSWNVPESIQSQIVKAVAKYRLRDEIVTRKKSKVDDKTIAKALRVELEKPSVLDLIEQYIEARSEEGDFLKSRKTRRSRYIDSVKKILEGKDE